MRWPAMPKLRTAVTTLFLSCTLAAAAGAAPVPPPFAIGEVLQYTILWGFVRVGESSMAITDSLRCSGRPCWVLKSQARSTGPLGLLFPVRDTIVSHWDPLGRRTLFSSKELHEGNYHRISVARFDPESNSATWSERAFSGNTNKAGERRAGARWRNRSGRTEGLPQQILDMLSALYSARSHPMRGRAGASFTMPIFDDGRLTKLHLSILGRETIRLVVNGRARNFAALVVQPKIRTSGIFRARGTTRVWISDDHRRWPLVVSSKVTLGSVTARLVGARDAQGPLPPE